MEDTRNVVVGFIPTREDFKGKFILGVAALIGAVVFVVIYNPAIFVGQLLEAFLFFALIRRAIFWIGKRVLNFTEVIAFIFAAGLLAAILLGDTEAIGSVKQIMQ